MRSSSDSDITARVRIRRAHTADADVLSRFAERIFRETFEAANDPADMAVYLAEAFSTERQAVELATPAEIIWLAEDIAVTNMGAGDAVTPLAGYSHLTPGDPPEPVRGPDPIELKRFYIDRPWQGTKLAHLLMHATLDAASAAGARTLWLGVWEHNPRAIAFYRKFAFVEVGSHDFMLGRDRQTDLIMMRQLTPDVTASTPRPTSS
jgi:GNAT superfamily N-acetyltransferase